MQFSDSPSYPEKLFSTYIPLHPKGRGPITKAETDEKYSAMNKWLIECGVKVHKDYEWDRIKYSVAHKAGVSLYPTGISFVNTDDALAFKLAFGL
jgi:hypothetical protein